MSIKFPSNSIIGNQEYLEYFYQTLIDRETSCNFDLVKWYTDLHHNPPKKDRSLRLHFLMRCQMCTKDKSFLKKLNLNLSNFDSNSQVYQQDEDSSNSSHSREASLSAKSPTFENQSIIEGSGNQSQLRKLDFHISDESLPSYDKAMRNHLMNEDMSNSLWYTAQSIKTPSLQPSTSEFENQESGDKKSDILYKYWYERGMNLAKKIAEEKREEARAKEIINNNLLYNRKNRQQRKTCNQQ